MPTRCDWRGNAVLALHNLSRRPCEATLKLGAQQFKELTDILTDRQYPALGPDDRRIPLSGYGYRWLRLEGTRR